MKTEKLSHFRTTNWKSSGLLDELSREDASRLESIFNLAYDKYIDTGYDDNQKSFRSAGFFVYLEFLLPLCRRVFVKGCKDISEEDIEMFMSTIDETYTHSLYKYHDLEESMNTQTSFMDEVESKVLETLLYRDLKQAENLTRTNEEKEKDVFVKMLEDLIKDLENHRVIPTRFEYINGSGNSNENVTYILEVYDPRKEFIDKEIFIKELNKEFYLEK